MKSRGGETRHCEIHSLLDLAYSSPCERGGSGRNEASGDEENLFCDFGRDFSTTLFLFHPWRLVLSRPVPCLIQTKPGSHPDALFIGLSNVARKKCEGYQ